MKGLQLIFLNQCKNLHNFSCSRAAPSALPDAQLSVKSEKFEFFKPARRAIPLCVTRNFQKISFSPCFTCAPRHTRMRDAQLPEDITVITP
ncbi:hypothetical protein A2U01_0049693 [Trifolium medium]|uniref:Uncharacterized protein n=1 Tax=Trifolium medium TaxID=97028 RepID=A0A392QX83_9FABA|nr:hypothetical protein [Trifolium medium]